MPIRVNCTSCDKSFSAWDDLKGKQVECPKCGSKVTVPREPRPDSKPAPRRGDEMRMDVPGLEPVAPAAKEPRPTQRRSVGVTQKPKLSPPKEASPEASSASRPSPPTVSDHGQVDEEFDDSDALPIVCVHCNEPLDPDEDLCDACGYHKILKKVIDLDGVVRRNRVTGLERIASKHLHDTESLSSTLLWAKVFLAFVAVTICMACLGFWWWLAVLAGGAAYAYLYLRTKAQRAEGQLDGANHDLLAQTVWNAMLVGQRAVGWRRLEWPFPQLEALVIRDPAFADADIAQLEKLENVRVIDLEGTSVTNAAVPHLAEHRQLDYLVIRKTQITPDGLQRLQNELKDTAIWL